MSRYHPRLWWGILLYLFIALSIFWLRMPDSYAVDWAPLWAAGRLALTEPSLVYDFDLVTQLQAEPYRRVIDRPYVYPPSALLVFAPLSLIPLWISFAIFSLGSLFILAWASSRVKADPVLIMAAPPVLAGVITGQPSLLVIALVVFACARLSKREFLAGALLACAAMIKPTLLVLAPIALIAGGYWRAIVAALATATAVLAISALLFGLEPWSNWVDSLPRFQQLIEERHYLLRWTVTPYANAARIGFESYWIIVAAALVAIPTVAFAFARLYDPALRSGVLIGGALLISPYAMYYELAALAPAVLARPRSKPKDLIIPSIWAVSLFHLSVVGLLTVFAGFLARLVGWRAGNEQAEATGERG